MCSKADLFSELHQIRALAYEARDCARRRGADEAVFRSLFDAISALEYRVAVYPHCQLRDVA